MENTGHRLVFYGRLCAMIQSSAVLLTASNDWDTPLKRQLDPEKARLTSNVRSHVKAMQEPCGNLSRQELIHGLPDEQGDMIGLLRDVEEVDCLIENCSNVASQLISSWVKDINELLGLIKKNARLNGRPAGMASLSQITSRL